MLRDVRLALRLIAGAGHRDVARLLLMAAGLALGVLAVLTALAVPRATAAADQRVASRTPIPVEQADTSARFSVVHQRLADRSWTRVLIWGQLPSTPAPPGMHALPAPGRTVVSPALEKALRTSADLRRQVGALTPGTISAPGLASPDELLSYTVLDTRPAEGTGTPLVAYGDRSASRESSIGTASLVELLLLVGLPCVLFLSVCARLSVNSRMVRLRAFRLIGVSADRCARIFSLEMGAVAVAGGLAGLGAFRALEPVLASSALVGLTWWPGDGSPSLVESALLTVCFALATTLVARRAMRRLLAGGRPPRDARSAASWPGPAGLMMTMLGLGFLAYVPFRASLLRPGGHVLAENLHMPLTYLAALVSVVGLLLVTPVATRTLGERWSRTAPTIGARLGFRYASTHTHIGARMVAALCGVILVGGFATAFLHSTYLDAVGDQSKASVSLPLTDVPATARAELARLDVYPHTVTISGRSSGVPAAVTLTVSSCAELARITAGAQDERTPCREQPQRVSGGLRQPPALAGGQDISVGLANHEVASVTAPEAEVSFATPGDLKLPPAAAPWAYLASQGEVDYTVSALDGSLEHLMADLAAIAPAAQPQADLKDPEAMAAFRQQTSVVRSGLVMGFVLALACFLMTIIDLRWESSRLTAAQQAIGAPSRTLRVALATQVAFPVAVGAAGSAVIGTLGGWAFLSFWGPEVTFYAPVAAWTGLLALLSVGISGATGWLCAGGSFKLERLRSP